MSKNIRQKIANVIQTTFRSSPQKKSISTKNKIVGCCSVKKPIDYEFVPYTSACKNDRSDYIDLSDCHSIMYPTTSDSGVSFDSNASTITSMSDDAMQPLQSTKINSDDTQSISKLSNYSYIPHDQHNISNFDVSAWHVVPTKFECCHCDCHVSATHASNKQSDKLQHLYYPVGAQTDTRSKNQVYPFIF